MRRNFRVGDIVVIKDVSVSQNMWKLGRIVEYMLQTTVKFVA